MAKVVAATTPEHFLALLEKSRLLSVDELAVAKKLAAEVDNPKVMARQLVRNGSLTPWQAGQILGGWHNLVVGAYCLKEQIDKSPFGRTFVAVHRKLDRQVRFIAVAKSIVQNEPLMDRVMECAQSASALNHTHLLHLLDVERDEDRCFIVCEHVVGRTLSVVLESQGLLPPVLAGSYLQQAASGLAHAHEHHVVHGALTVDNVLIDRSGKVKIQGLGTAQFEAHLEGDPAIERDDVVALSRLGVKLLDEDRDEASGQLYGHLKHGLAGELTMHQLHKLITRWNEKHFGDDDDEFNAPVLDMSDEDADDSGMFEFTEESVSSPRVKPPKRNVERAVEEEAGDDTVEHAPPARRSGLSLNQIVAIVATVLILVLGGVLWLIFFGGGNSDAAPKTASNLSPKSQPGFTSKDPEESDPEAVGAPGDKVGDPISLMPKTNKQALDPKKAAAKKKKLPVPPGNAQLTNATAAKTAKTSAGLKNKQAPKKQPPTAGKKKVQPANKKKPAPSTKKKKQPPAKKKAVAKKPAPKPVKVFQIPAVVQLPKPQDPPRALGVIDVNKGDLVFAKLEGGNEAIRGDATKIEMEQATARKWPVFLKTKQTRKQIAEFQLDGKRFMFRWLPAAAKERYAYHLCNCVIAFSARQQTHDLALRQVVKVDALVVNLDRTGGNRKWPIEYLPDPTQIRIEIGRIAGKFPKHRWEHKIFRGNKGRNVLWIGATKDKEILGIRLESKASRFVQVSMMAQLREPGSRRARRFSTKEAATTLNKGRFLSQSLEQQLKTPGLTPQQKNVVSARKKIIDATVGELEKLGETYQMINRQAQLHFRVIHMVGIKRFPLAVTVAPRPDAKQLRRKGRTKRARKNVKKR